MPDWPDQPWILEVNAWTWLSQLSSRLGSRITLHNVPENIWDEFARSGADGIWLMGVWKRSREARSLSLSNPGIVAECRSELADFTSQDIAGSPYAIAEYVVDSFLGGPDGLVAARRQLSRRGLRLLLDFVPNHVAPDHPWIGTHPEYFVRGEESDLSRDPQTFFRAGEFIVAHGRDPYFPPWPDTAQLNVFEPALRAAAAKTVCAIAAQCDGVRCDMAMLLMNRIFAQTWGPRAGAAPPTEYWPELIAQVREVHPRFLFIAEAYWDLEWELLQQGFDYCYDKRLYDRLVEGNASRVREHLAAQVSYQHRMLRFLENHDEPRAAAVLSSAQNRVAAVALMTLPGGKLFQDGQFAGAKIRPSVHLGRCPEESPDIELREFYRNLIDIVRATDLRNGIWDLCQLRGWADNHSCENLIAWIWHAAGRKLLIVLNLSPYRSQAQVILPWSDLGEREWRVLNLLPRREYGRKSGDEILRAGLFVDLDSHGFHLLELVAAEV